MTENRVIEGRTPDGRSARLLLAGPSIGTVTHAPAGAADGPLLLPGLVDLQVNGYAGYDINADDVSVDTVRALTRALWAVGTTTYFPTVITASQSKIVHALEVIATAVRDDPLLAHSIAGIHVEGPYLSAAHGARGVHDPAHLRHPDPAELASWLEASGGLLRIVTLAPELPGTGAYVEAAMRAGVLVSVGHSAAAPEDIRRAADAGASLCTHLGNGIQPMLPRHPNQIWAQLADDRLSAGFIADGHHLPADALTAMIRAKGVARSFLVSDSVTLAGSVPGRYATDVGGEVTVAEDGRLLFGDSGLLAGSGASLADCVRFTRDSTAFGDADVVALATENPARVAGLADRGSLRAGAAADVVIVDEDFRVRNTIVAGTLVFRREDR
ncbi:N-acetylglucosamine-6-phosphate deacetylase [Kitasatospora sp. NPDC052896]|uniref:N-acetylglucosamine-6-phosphate deacetylase n=1 Tax=Kitasatospora sp. NPDC052896 TaxID=3364061 RepID=UPI0037C95C5F